MQAPQRRGQRILAVDDDEDDLERLRDRLTRQGYEVIAADNGRAALDLARKTTPQLILLDTTMPEMGGLDVCRQLKADAATRDIPVLFLAAAGEPLDRVQGLTAGALDYINKPFDSAELSARTACALRLKQLQDQLRLQERTDGATDLWNRAYFEEQLAREVRRYQRYGSPVSMVLVGLHDFEHLNKAFGQVFGEEILKGVASILRRDIRCVDLAARWAGDAFAILAPETPLHGAIPLTRRVCTRIRERTFVRDEQAVHVAASAGIASAGPDACDGVADLTRRAEACLSAARQAGRSTIGYRAGEKDRIVRVDAPAAAAGARAR